MFNMDSSDDELFTATPSCSKSIINTSLNLATKQTNDVVQKPVKEKDSNKCRIKDISITITRLPNKKKNITTNKHLTKNKRKRNMWKFGSYKKKKSTKKLSTQQVQVAKEKSNTKDVPQDAEDVQNGRENAEDLTLLTYETQNKEEDLCVDKTHTCARVLSYDVHQKRKTTSSNNTTDAVACYILSSSSNSDITEENSNTDQIYASMLTPSSSNSDIAEQSSNTDQIYTSVLTSSSSNNDIAEQNSNTDKINAFMLTLPENRKRAMQALRHERLRRMSKKCAIQGEPSEWKSKRKRLLSASFDEFNSKKKHRRILLDESSDDEILLQSKREMIRNDQNQFHSFKKMDEEPRSNIPINREVCVTLTRLEQMDDVDVLRWRANKIRNALEIIESQSVREQHLDKQEQVKCRRNKNISVNECNLLQTQDVHEDLLQLSVTPSTRANKHCPARLNSLDMTNLRKKYKLFKKPRVLIIKLDSLMSLPENGKYSAVEIDCLTKKYIDYVISSTYSKPRELLLYGRLRRKNITDVNTEDDKRRYSLSGGETMNKSFEQSNKDGSSKKDDQIMESSNKNTLVISNESQNKNLSPKTKSKNNNSQKTLLEIWKNAFCTQKSVKKPQNTHTEQVASAQSTPAKTVSTLQNSSKKWASTECKSSVSNKSPVSSSLIATSTASTKDNTSIKSPSKHASPKKQESAQSTKRDETSQLECFSNTNSSNIETIKETVTKDDFLQSQNSTNSIRSPHKKVVKNDIIQSDSSLNMELSKKSSKNPKDKNSKFKCFTCNMLFDQYRLLLKHRPCPMLDNALKHKEFTKILNKKIDKIGQDKNLKPLTSLHNSSINKESKSCNNTDKEKSSSSSLSSGRELQSKRLSTPQTNTTLNAKLNPDLNLRITRSKIELAEMKKNSNVNGDKGKQCKVCLQSFNNYLQLFEHMYKHANRTIKNVYKFNKNNSISLHQKTNKNKSGVSDTLTEDATLTEETRINVQEKELIENTNESNTDQSLAALQVSQYKEAAKKTDKTSNSQAEIEQNLQEDNAIPVVNDNRKNIQCTGKYIQKPISNCSCHKLKLIENNYTVQIEMVSMCDFCKVVFRRDDCFRTHFCTQRNSDRYTKWIKRHRNKTTLLLCVACQKVLASIPDLQIHLNIHAKLAHRNLELTFFCNICKIIFHTQGPLFNSHFINHVKNPSFLASRVTFPPNTYAGVELVETLHENGEKQMEVYIKIADYKCQDCCALFVSEETLQAHKLILCHEENSAAVDKNNTGTSDNTNACLANKMIEKILLLCGFCSKTFYKRMDFEMHSLEHKVKRDPKLHYTCVTVTAITKLFICKVCMTMWKSYEDFLEHWQTHNRLQEDYICSICQNHYDTLDLCQEHILTHKNITEHFPISCKVIYRDLDFETNLRQIAINDDLSSASSSSLDGKRSDTNLADNSIQEKPSRISVKQNLSAENKQSTREGTLKDLLPGRSPKKPQTIGNDMNVQQKSLEQVPSTDVAKSKQTAENGNNKESKNNNNNLQKSDNLEEEEMIIVVSESDDNSMPSENGKAESKKTANASPTKCNEQKSAFVTSDPTRIASDEQGQCLSDASAHSINADKTSKSNAELNLTASTSNATINLTKEREANANDSEDNEIIVEQVVNSPATTQQVDSVCKNVADDGPTSSSTQSTKIKVKDMSLPQNAMSSVPKSFLRVKSLAELTDDSPQNFLCHICGLFFDNLLALIKHKEEHVHIRADTQDVNQAHSSKDIQMSQNKPEFNPSMYRTQIQNPVPHSMNGNALPSGNVLSSGNAPVSNNASVNIVPLSTYILYNMPPSDNVNPSGSVNPNNNASLNQVINLRNFQPHQVAGIKPLHKVPYNITQNKIIKPKEAPQYSYSTGLTKVGLNNSIVTSQQKPIYHQNLPAQIPYSLTTVVQPAHQSTVAVRPFIQTVQASRPPPPYPQQQQQQQQQEQQRTTTGSDVRYSAVSKDGVPYQLTSNSTVPINMTNLNNVFNPMIQVSKNPNRFICLFCPFECTSVQDCAIHQHLSKHKARTNNNNTFYASST